jgi:ribosomal protein S18 acetylase RimI-like enzyme
MSTFLHNKSDEYPIINSASLVACSGNEIVGFCYTCNWRGTPLIWDFAVPKLHQGKGIGKFLLGNVLTKLQNKGYNQVGLFVTQANNISKKLYKSFGFQTNPCSLLRMSKNI